MNDSLEASTSVFAQGWAVRLGFALLAGLTLIVGLAFADAGRRAKIETASETTAVGDKVLVSPAAAANALQPVAVLEGKPLYLSAVKPMEIRESHTARVGHDDGTGLSIYGLSSAATTAEMAKVEPGRVGYLLKSGVNEFVLAAPQEK